MDQVQLVKAAKAALQVREDRRYQMQAWRESVVAKLNTGAEVGEARAKLDEAELEFKRVHGNAVTDCKRYHSGMGDTGRRLVLLFSKLIAGIDRDRVNSLHSLVDDLQAENLQASSFAIDGAGDVAI